MKCKVELILSSLFLIAIFPFFSVMAEDGTVAKCRFCHPFPFGSRAGSEGGPRPTEGSHQRRDSSLRPSGYAQNDAKLSISQQSEDTETARRIISFGPAITEGIYLLGIEDRLIGCTVYCQIPPKANVKEKVGTVRDVNVEKIVSLMPDLVLATSVTNRNDIEKLKGLKIKTVCFATPKNFIDICDQFLELGKITGREKEAVDIVKKANAKVNLIKAKVENLPKPKVFIQTGAKPLFTAGRDSFIHDYINRAGGINIAAGLDGGFDYGIYSKEEVVSKNPDVIFIVTMGIIGEQEKNAWEKFKCLNAVRDNRIYIIDSHRACSPTPLSFAEILGEIAAFLHPGAIHHVTRTYNGIKIGGCL